MVRYWKLVGVVLAVAVLAVVLVAAVPAVKPGVVLYPTLQAVDGLPRHTPPTGPNTHVSERKLRTPFLINEWGVKSMLQWLEKKTGT